MYTANFLVWLLFFYLNLKKGHSHDLSPGAIANAMCKIYTDNAKKNNICPLSKFKPSISRAVFAESGDFPHMIQLGYQIDDNTEWICSGSIISKNYVLIAAHCTSSRQRGVNVTQLRVRAGVTDQKDLSNAQIRNVESIKLHSKVEIPVKYNDIALIKVKEDFIFNKFVGPVCLYTNEKNPDGKGLQTGLSTATLESFPNSTTFTIRKRRQNSLKCTLPPQLENGRWVVTEADVNPDDLVDINTIIRFECHKGYQLYPNNPLLLCDGSWDETTFPICQKKCPPLYSTTTTTLTCKDIHNGAVPCDEAVDGTSLTYICSAYYEIPPGGRNTLYCYDGVWNFPKPICEPSKRNEFEFC
ncbi:unnamed protein product [Diabrotica balteata]|uniref:Uncharacterized protein n=1 Tax=Diabrotica balteata TaxID=107213 RepID=A0A9N9XG08_DIABA|nr:unnamed protein product [Diabrotica balteata]